MNRRSAIVVSAATMLGVASVLSHTIAQQSTIKEQIVGTWTLVSATVERDGTKIEPFGPNPLGYFIFTAGGHFS